MSCTIEAATDRDYLHVAALDRISWPTAPDLFIPDGEHIWRIWCDLATLLVARQPTDADPLPESENIAGGPGHVPHHDRRVVPSQDHGAPELSG